MRNPTEVDAAYDADHGSRLPATAGQEPDRNESQAAGGDATLNEWMLARRVVTQTILRAVTSRCLVEFLDTVRVSLFDYAVVSSGMLTSGSACRSVMECSEK